MYSICVHSGLQNCGVDLVVLFPGTKDKGWRWQTSNNDYGKFYLSLSRETLGERCRADGLHSECNRKCEQLARQLCELKSELDRLKVGSRLASPRERDGCRDTPHCNGDCLFSEKARMPCDDMFHTTHDIEYNGGRRTEPQVLEDHLKADHPRLVKKVPPLHPADASCFEAAAEHGGGQSEHVPRYGRGKVSKYWTGHDHAVQIHSTPGTAHSDGRMYRLPEPAGSGGVHQGENLGSVGEYHHHGGSGGNTSPRGARHHRPHTAEQTKKEMVSRTHYGGGKGGGHLSSHGDGSKEKILPPSQRYNFYRYYGFAGQGAKTSRGWNSK